MSELERLQQRKPEPNILWLLKFLLNEKGRDKLKGKGDKVILTDDRASSEVWPAPFASPCSDAVAQPASHALRAPDRPLFPWYFWPGTPEIQINGGYFCIKNKVIAQHNLDWVICKNPVGSLCFSCIPTGSLRGVQLHFLRKLRILRAGKCCPEPVLLPSCEPISSARAVASVARLWRSNISNSSSVMEQKKEY